MSNMTKIPVNNLLQTLQTLRNIPHPHPRIVKQLLKIESHIAMRGANPDKKPWVPYNKRGNGR